MGRCLPSTISLANVCLSSLDIPKPPFRFRPRTVLPLRAHLGRSGGGYEGPLWERKRSLIKGMDEASACSGIKSQVAGFPPGSGLPSFPTRLVFLAVCSLLLSEAVFDEALKKIARHRPPHLKQK